MNAPTDAATEQATDEHTSSPTDTQAADERFAEMERRLAEMAAQVAATQAAQAAEPIYQGEPVSPRRSTVQMTLRDLRTYDGPLYVKHNDPQRQFSCHQSLGEHRVDFDLGPAGSPQGDDIGHLPKLALEIRGIQRAMMRGTITISTDEAMEDEIMLNMGQHVKASEDQLSALMSPLQPSNNEKDIVTKPCLVCGEYVHDELGQKTMVIRGGQVFQKFADYRAGVPPLCPMHENQAHLWAGHIAEDPTTGVREWSFSTITTGPTQPGVPPVYPPHYQ